MNKDVPAQQFSQIWEIVGCFSIWLLEHVDFRKEDVFIVGFSFWTDFIIQIINCAGKFVISLILFHFRF